MSSSNPISPKVVAAAAGAAAGAGAGAIVSTLALWIVGVVAYGVPGDADSVADAVAAVPTPISGAVLLILAVAGAALAAFRSGYVTTDPLRLTSDNFPDGFDDGASDPDGMDDLRYGKPTATRSGAYVIPAEGIERDV